MRERTYKVTWVIDVIADSTEDAARKALAIQRDPNSIATVFDVAYTTEVKEEKINIVSHHVEIDLNNI